MWRARRQLRWHARAGAAGAAAMSGSAPDSPEDYPRLPSGALDRSRICDKERQAFEQCHGGSFLGMLQRIGESLSGGSMEAKCETEFEAYEDCVAITVARLRAMQDAAAAAKSR